MGFGSGAVCDIRLNTILSEEQRGKFQNPVAIREILSPGSTVAIIGLSTEKTKASNMVASYLLDEGYRVVPVNPRAKEILGVPCYPDLASIPFPVDVVDVFRPASEVPAIVDEVIRLKIPAVWLQLRIVDPASGDRAHAAGVKVVMDRCVKMEHGRYSGALHWAGMNTEVITAQRRR